MGYMAVTAHWIDADWNLHTTVLEFVRFSTPYTGKSASTVLYNKLEYWVLAGKW